MSHTTFSPTLPARGKVTIAQAVGVYCLVSVWLNLAYPGFKLLNYAMPFFALIAVLSEKRLEIPAHAPPYLVLILAGIAIAPTTAVAGWQDLYLMLIGLAPFCFGYPYRHKWSTIAVFTLIAAVIGIALAKSGHGGGGFEFDAAKSKSSFESSTCFVFGLLAVWAALERSWKRAAFAVIMCILTLKRIVVLAVFITIMVSLLPRGITLRLLSPLPMVILNAVFLAAVFSYTQGHLDYLIVSFTNQSANQLGMGRQALYKIPVDTILHSPIDFIFHGVGSGGVYDLIKSGRIFAGKPNLHNDMLKILVEYGALFWVAFISALYWNRNLPVKIIMLFANTLLLTDNSLIYPFLIFAIGLVLANISASLPKEGGGLNWGSSKPHAS